LLCDPVHPSRGHTCIPAVRRHPTTAQRGRRKRQAGWQRYGQWNLTGCSNRTDSACPTQDG